ncbi:MBOAT family O-acyltransferase [Flammeovirga pacifica]|uniref:Membrane-bound O-acyltransferase family protein n=1 Tax=Flammeovirga pacifica TaxID=915059 RepID=A0A1S1YX38_FLAPC|nr:MBOAT family O-acyltransferase [Flammeovirga pacifica]OHX65548.1 membrane-bound O-acyltransferase family protein [Flammeovirga pacifica]
MLFNSIEFAIFLPIVFILYWFCTKENIKAQNILLLIASYVFYGWWDWRFLSLIAFSSFIDFSIGKKIGKTVDPKARKWLLKASLFVNLGLLGLFKYYNFFVESFAEAFTIFGTTIHVDRLNIVLPVGISFYTFQTLSYTIDVYKRKLEPTENIVDFFAFVSFFPQLVAGPIERATHLLPQFQRSRYFEYDKAVDGMRQILWGLFKKVVIADNCAFYANIVFNNYEDYNGSSLLLGAIFFSFQIYGDFSGYSDIAIGTARLFGFDLMQNFAFPYFSRDIAEFWRRWHISLSTWFRDYLYIPLGGSKGGTWMKVRNTFIIFLVSGFWHGSNWTFIAWGALNAIYFIPLLLMKRNRSNMDVVAQDRLLPSLKELFQMGITYFMVVIAWLFFRAETIKVAFEMIEAIFTFSNFGTPYIIEEGTGIHILPKKFLLSILIFLTVEWYDRTNTTSLEPFTLLSKYVRWCIYLGIGLSIFLFKGNEQTFIYFQF